MTNTKLSLIWIVAMTFYFTIVVGWPLWFALPFWFIATALFRKAHRTFVK